MGIRKNSISQLSPAKYNPWKDLKPGDVGYERPYGFRPNRSTENAISRCTSPPTPLCAQLPHLHQKQQGLPKKFFDKPCCYVSQWVTYSH